MNLLKVAAILDDFSFSCFSPDCELLQLQPHCWLNQLLDFKPDILFVESAWFGDMGLWHGKLTHHSQEMTDLLLYCKKIGIKNIFWCKEDPVDFHRFIGVAEKFDFVFTTDIQCIPLYKRLLGHSRVHLLPFAGQPKFHNPIQKFKRENSACFAGSYYVRYPQRTRDLDAIFESVNLIYPMVIYDRYHGSSDLNYKFPDKFNDFIVGYLPSNEIDRAYKGYALGINLNTIKNSESMFARRIFELLACGTVTVSNESPGLHFLFGQLILVSDHHDVLLELLGKVSKQPLMLSKLALAGLRKVMLEHTYSHRLGTVMQKVFDVDQGPLLPCVFVIAHALKHDEFYRLQSMLINQTEVNWHALILISEDFNINAFTFDPRIQVLRASEVAEVAVSDFVDQEAWVAGMSASDYYGPNYLLDLILGTRYSKALAFGKAGFFDASSGAPVLLHQDLCYFEIKKIKPRSGIFAFELMNAMKFSDWVNAMEADTALDVGEQGQALDCFNYCLSAFSVGLSAHEVSPCVDDLLIDTGQSMDALYEKADAMGVHIPAWLGKPAWRLQKLADAFGAAGEGEALHGSLDKFGWHLVSEIHDGDFASIWAENTVPVDELGGTAGLKFHVVEGPGLPVELLVRFETEGGRLLSELKFETNSNQQWVVPDGAAHVRLGWRVFSSGTTRIMRFALTWL